MDRASLTLSHEPHLLCMQPVTRSMLHVRNLSLDLLSLGAAYAVVLTWETISAQLSRLTACALVAPPAVVTRT